MGYAPTIVRLQAFSMDTKKRRRSCLRSEVLRKPAITDKSRLRYAQAFTDLFQL